MARHAGNTARLLDPDADLERLVRQLIDDGYRVIAPVERHGSVAYEEIDHADELPVGLTVDQQPGHWRSAHDGTRSRFGWTPGADSWKRWFFPPEQQILSLRRQDGSFAVEAPPSPGRPLALLGARDCEVRALRVLDRVLADPDHPDPRYVDRRAGTFVVAVTCGRPAETCWCTSMGGGPRPSSGFDIAITELLDHGRHRLLAEPGSRHGADLLDAIGAQPATDDDIREADAVATAASGRIADRLDGQSIADRLAGTELHAQWERIATRCLSCGNCTLVCPTCFCSRVEDRTELAPAPPGGANAHRHQRWASCFELDHSNLVGRPVRATTASRYRQWLTHKLQTWPEQFGTTGCVGCGRCTTWCPAGIDLAVEANTLVGAAEGVGP